MRVDCQGFPCHSVKLVLPASSDKYEVDSNMFFSKWYTGNALYSFEIWSFPNSELFDRNQYYSLSLPAVRIPSPSPVSLL
jgi:hypothetical protein